MIWLYTEVDIHVQRAGNKWMLIGLMAHVRRAAEYQQRQSFVVYSLSSKRTLLKQSS